MEFFEDFPPMVFFHSSPFQLAFQCGTSLFQSLPFFSIFPFEISLSFMIMSITASFWDVDASDMRIWVHTASGVGRLALLPKNFITIEKVYIQHENEAKFNSTRARGAETITECIEYSKDSR